MKDGRLFESVFFTRGGNQDFGLYADDGTDIGRRFYQGVGHHETGYKRSDGVDIGSLLFDNTEPVQGYITNNLPNNTLAHHEIVKGNNYTNYGNVDNVIFAAHPQRGSGIYSYSWTWWDSGGYNAMVVHTGTNKQVIATTASTLSLPYPDKWDKTNGYYGLSWRYGSPKWWIGKTIPYFCCNIKDMATGNVTSPSMTFTVTYSCTDCGDCDCDCD